MKIDTSELIQYIVWYATERQTKLTTVRLVKFLYLADVEWARENNGVTLTGWPWRFVHYGPFCGESLHAIEKTYAAGLIKKDSYESKFTDGDYYLYWSDEEAEAQRLPSYLRAELNEAISRWGDDTYGLLDYVYFETEPMLDARKGDLLDFSKAIKLEKPKEIIMLKLSPERIAKGKEIIERLKNKYKKEMASRSSGRQPIYDETYHQATEFLNEQDLEGELSGEATISIIEIDEY